MIFLFWFFLPEDNRLNPAPPTGRDTNRQQTDDVVRSVDQSSSMADQSRQIKLAAAKKKVKYFIIELAWYHSKHWQWLSSVGLCYRCGYTCLYGAGVLSFHVVRPLRCRLSHLSRSSRGLNAQERPMLSSGPLLIALTFPAYVDYF